MPLQNVLKIARLIVPSLAICSLILWGVLKMPSPWSGVFFGISLLCMIFVVAYVLDRMVPGVNLFSRAPHRLPKEKAKGAVVVTFDDGPSEPYTREILDILDRFQVKATFFCIGENVKAHPDIAKAIVQRGHEIGTHSMTHRSLPSLPSSEIRSEISQAHSIVRDVCGVDPLFFRCPKGYKSRTVEKLAHQEGQRMIGFSYPLYDVENPPAQEIVDRALRKVKEGDILLMHDGYSSSKPGKRDSLVEALPAILEGVRAKGLRVISLRDVWGSP